MKKKIKYFVGIMCIGTFFLCSNVFCFPYRASFSYQYDEDWPVYSDDNNYENPILKEMFNDLGKVAYRNLYVFDNYIINDTKDHFNNSGFFTGLKYSGLNDKKIKSQGHIFDIGYSMSRLAKSNFDLLLVASFSKLNNHSINLENKIDSYATSFAGGIGYHIGHFFMNVVRVFNGSFNTVSVYIDSYSNIRISSAKSSNSFGVGFDMNIGSSMVIIPKLDVRFSKMKIVIMKDYTDAIDINSTSETRLVPGLAFKYNGLFNAINLNFDIEYSHALKSTNKLLNIGNPVRMSMKALSKNNRVGFGLYYGTNGEFGSSIDFRF